jgi:hypothetical protein
LEHDALAHGYSFEAWLEEYHNAFIVLNIKEEGLESTVIETLTRWGIDNWAFLDQSFPFMVKLLRSGESRVMARVSEYESIDTVVRLPWKPEWIWLDSFTGRWPSPAEISRLSRLGHKLMIVSPELQGRDLATEQKNILQIFVDAGVPLDGVCSKQPERWERQATRLWES